jgi:DNA-directed RNA polymerase specialized sigma24 family protein
MIELAGVQPGEDDRVAELLLAGLPQAHRLAASILRDPVGAEDAVQEALLRAWHKRRGIRFGDGAPDRWFLRIGVNVCRDELAAGAASRSRRFGRSRSPNRPPPRRRGRPRSMTTSIGPSDGCSPTSRFSWACGSGET